MHPMYFTDEKLIHVYSYYGFMYYMCEVYCIVFVTIIMACILVNIDQNKEINFYL